MEAMPLGVAQQIIKDGHKQQAHDDGPRIEGQSHLVDEEDLAPAKKFQYIGQGIMVDQQQYDHHNDIGKQKVLDRGGAVFFKVVQQAYGGNGQKAHELDPEGQAHHKTDEQEPTVPPWIIEIVRPFEAQPEQKGHDQAGHGIDLGLHDVEPETIGEDQGQGTDQAGGQYGQGPGVGQRPVFREEFSGKVGDGPKGEQYGKGTGDNGNCVDHECDLGGIPKGEHGEKGPDHLQQGGPGGVSHLQFGGG